VRGTSGNGGLLFYQITGRAARHLGVSVSGLRGGLDAPSSSGMDLCKVIALVDKCMVSQVDSIL
jgi:hypothetical protein